VIPLELSSIEPLGRVVARPWADVVTGMQVDSRRIEEGDLFVAVDGGRDFVEHAFARGAAAALVPEDPFAALAAIAGAVRERSKARVVGITGSTGKTSTKDILYALCAPHRRTIANEGNFNTEIGVPLTICRIEEDTELCISELAMRGLGQIAWLASFVKPDVGVITNVGPVHLELVETIENVARAKGELIEALPAGGVAVVPEEPLLEPYLQRADIFIKRVPDDASLPFTPSFSARHQLANARLAAAVAECLDVPLPETLTVEFSKLREEERPLPGGGLLLNDCYNANPVSMRAALEHLAERGSGHRRVAVLGSMAELGGGSARYHEEIAALLRELGIERVIAVGEEARVYGGEWVHDAAAAAERLRAELRPGDVVLVKGSRSVGLEVVAENLP
jgi:UDP-N-acetylmuramoyl-tripeptide--D-alanyl-D-alanine ligase